MLAEAPRHKSAAELLELARDKELWREMTHVGPEVKTKAKGDKRSDAFMLANGYFFWMVD